MGSNLKEKVDAYLIKHYKDIEEVRGTKDFRWNDVATQINKDLAGEYVRNRYIKIRKNVGTTPSNIGENITVDTSGSIHLVSGNENKDKGTKEFTFTASNIPTEEEIISHFSIDITKYKISQIWHKTTPGGRYSLSVNLQTLKGGDAVDYIGKFEKFIENYNGSVFNKESKNPKPLSKVRDALYLCSLSDIHVGNYQKPGYLEGIKKRVKETFLSLSQMNVEKVLLLNTGDMIHFDSSKNQTFSGTQLDGELSYEDAFTSALDLITDIIDYASSLCLSLTFVNVRGNHSFDTEYIMGEALRRIYKKDKNIEILNNKDTRLYYKWKNNGFMFTHGERGVDRLPLMFATEGKEVFKDTDFHHILLGHLHHSKGKQFITDTAEFAGIEVRVIGSPTSNDVWHKQNAFCQNKKNLTCFLYTQEEGKTAEFNFKM